MGSDANSRAGHDCDHDGCWQCTLDARAEAGRLGVLLGDAVALKVRLVLGQGILWAKFQSLVEGCAQWEKDAEISLEDVPGLAAARKACEDMRAEASEDAAWVLSSGGEALGVHLSLEGARQAAWDRLGHPDGGGVSERRSDSHGEVVSWWQGEAGQSWPCHAQKTKVKL